MLGGMQDFELRVPRLLDHAAREHGGREIVSRWADGRETRTDWAGIARAAKQLAQALERLGMRPGDRIATLAMNHAHHLIAWYGAIGMGGVIHTINPRLFDEQLIYIANHAEDRVLFYDRQFAPLVERLKPHWTRIEHYVCLDDGMFDALLAPESGDHVWHEGPERDPCMLCYTSGTTGNPKGVLYEHRSTVIHAMAEVAPWVFDLSPSAVVLPVVPMFHAASWGLPFACALAGTKCVYSAVNDAAVLCRLMNDERVTHSAGVPTVWLAMFAHMDATGEAPRHLRQVTIGGSAAPRAMIERIMGLGVTVKHLWGMTETSPIGTAGFPPPDWETMTDDARLDHVGRQGQVPFGIELQVVDDEGRVLPRDGATAGRLQVRGPWVVKRYFKADADAVGADQWFDTGDVALLHADGTMQITDRAKDVIKSGGEWISSVDLENAAVGCSGVAEAAAIGVPHPKWGERPLLLVVRKPGSAVTPANIVDHLGRHVAKWWLPDEIVFVDDLPHTATGKLLKTALREKYGRERTTTPLHDPTDVLNWRRVSGIVTTSGQPTARQLSEIAALGIKHVVNLGPATHPRALPDEAIAVAAFGMRYHYIPVDFDAPTEADFAMFVETMAKIGDSAVHVHCIVNARVTAFLYRLALHEDGDVADAAARMESVWRPGGVWATFVGNAAGRCTASRFAGRDY